MAFMSSVGLANNRYVSFTGTKVWNVWFSKHGFKGGEEQERKLNCTGQVKVENTPWFPPRNAQNSRVVTTDSFVCLSRLFLVCPWSHLTLQEQNLGSSFHASSDWLSGCWGYLIVGVPPSPTIQSIMNCWSTTITYYAIYLYCFLWRKTYLFMFIIFLFAV